MSQIKPKYDEPEFLAQIEQFQGFLADEGLSFELPEQTTLTDLMQANRTIKAAQKRSSAYARLLEMIHNDALRDMVEVFALNQNPDNNYGCGFTLFGDGELDDDDDRENGLSLYIS